MARQPKPKVWPDDGKPVSLEELTGPLCQAIRFAYSMRRKNRNKDIPYNGYEAAESPWGPSAKVALKAANLQYSEHDQGRDALTELIGIVLRVGIEQGQRMAKTDSEYQAMKIMASINSDLLREAAQAKGSTFPE